MSQNGSDYRQQVDQLRDRLDKLARGQCQCRFKSN